MCAWQEQPLFVGVAVGGEVHELAPDATIVQKRIAFSGSAIAYHALSCAFGVNKELEKVAFCPHDLLREARVAFEPTEPCLMLR